MAMLPSDLLEWFFILFVLAPAAAAILAFKGPPPVRPIARWVLLSAWLAHAAATLACLRYAVAKPSSGIGNGVFFLVAIPVAFFAVICFGIWRAARRRAGARERQVAKWVVRSPGRGSWVSSPCSWSSIWGCSIAGRTRCASARRPAGAPCGSASRWHSTHAVPTEARGGRQVAA